MDVRDTPDLPMRIKRAVTIGRPDETYPPYRTATVYVRSIFTSTITSTKTLVNAFVPAVPTTTITTSVDFVVIPTLLPIETFTVTVTRA